ncbi:3-ketoacyl-CoA synthase 7 [Acorus gramineus]|uniref:3-ketoacyl-CoA synthase n=1 Tax=Acorus gramineus TaxID=55184 RepID=A0AAV9BSR0_ACOGR|nr:3-ketoacyl-CoA synthase 7 [Acorus gramineus]
MAMVSPSINPNNIIHNLLSLDHLPHIAAIIITLTAMYCSYRSKKLYILDFSCYQGPDFCRAPVSTYLEHYEISGQFDQDNIKFQAKILERSGLGNEPCVPPGIKVLPPDLSFNASLKEVEDVLFTATEDVLTKNKVNPKTIDILITNCSLFCPTPSMSSMVINRFGFRSNVMSFSLSGMGCSAGILSVSMARDLLKVHKNSVALVLSMEAVTVGGYEGKVKSMLLANCLFRMGGAAILLSNRKKDKKTAKYVLKELVHTNLASDNKSYECIFQQPDEEGIVGVSLSRDILQVAGNALMINLSSLAPKVLPYKEKFKYGWFVIKRKYWEMLGKKKLPIPIPDFRTCFGHFCIHAGGRAMIEAIEENLGLREEVEASKMALYRFGNTSSSSIWYALCYLEAKGRVKKGDKVWQVAFGSGFMCNSAVWECVSDIDSTVKNAWSDRIHLYPVKVPDVLDH